MNRIFLYSPMIPAWLSFLIVIALILVFSKKELSIVLAVAAILLAFLVQVDLLNSFLIVLLDPSIIFLTLAVTLIPILGGIMEKSGLMYELVQKLDISKKVAIILTPALFGALPVPGGALMSAPIIDQIDPELNPGKKVSANVWYRHALILIYPLSSPLIIGSYLAGLGLYVVIAGMMIPFLLMISIGYLFLVKSIKETENSHQRDLKRAFHNLIPILIAPIIDFVGRLFFDLSFPEIFLFTGLIIAIFIALEFADMQASNIKKIAKEMKIWRFPLLIFSMFLFLEIFRSSAVPDEIGSLELPFIMFMLIGFFLGFATGRIQLPISILVPIFLIQFSLTTMSLAYFVFLYFSIFLGYIMTPIHPCISYSIDYFNTTYKKTLKDISIPTFTCFLVLIAVYFFFSTFLV